MSAERLVKLIDLNAPDVIIANEVSILFKKALGLNSKMAEIFAEDIARPARAWAGRCYSCGGEIEGLHSHVSDSCCKACHEKFKSDLQLEDDDLKFPS